MTTSNATIILQIKGKANRIIIENVHGGYSDFMPSHVPRGRHGFLQIPAEFEIMLPKVKSALPCLFRGIITWGTLHPGCDPGLKVS